jgi:hypothetical protein
VTMATMMTKTEARKLAKRARQFGYFRPNPTGAQVYVKRPQCRERVQAEGFPWDTVSGLMKVLDAAMVEHVMEWCER